MDLEDISDTCFVPLQKSLIENATIVKMYCHAYPLSAAKLISKSGFFPPVCSCQLSTRPLGLLLSNYHHVTITCDL
jgi:hypothetical protein